MAAMFLLREDSFPKEATLSWTCVADVVTVSNAKADTE